MRQIIYRRVLACLAVILVFSQVFQLALKYHKESLAAVEEVPVEEELTLWYTDEKLNEYLVKAAAQFEQERDVEVTLQLVTAVDYIELIGRASVSESGGPDLHIASSELLEKARLAGLAAENDSYMPRELEARFPQKALDAASCGGKLVAYPFYFETCFLLYNRNYVEQAPDNVDAILAFSDTFEAAGDMEKVENIFKWNVSDIFYDFFFIANYVNLGGPTGDDPYQVALAAEKVVQCLQYYQSLNEFFAIDAETVTTDDVLQEFMDGKTIYTIAKTDAIARLDEASDQEEHPFYGIALVPDLTEELQTKGLSVTNSVVVNPYSDNRNKAKEFARYITYDKVDDLYALSQKMPVKKGVVYENEQMQILIDQYEDSVEVPKITELSNYWLWMELTFANIWKGNDVQTEIHAISERIHQQLAAE